MNNRPTGGDDTPVVGSGRMPDFLRNTRLPDLPPDVDQTTADLMILLSRNRNRLKFREVDIEFMDDHTKKALLEDIYLALGVAPLHIDDPE